MVLHLQIRGIGDEIGDVSSTREGNKRRKKEGESSRREDVGELKK